MDRTGTIRIDGPTFASVVSYVHDMLRRYEAAAQRDVGEGGRLIDGARPAAPTAEAIATRSGAIGFAVACIGETLHRIGGAGLVADVADTVEQHYRLPSALLLRRFWAGLPAERA